VGFGFLTGVYDPAIFLVFLRVFASSSGKLPDVRIPLIPLILLAACVAPLSGHAADAPAAETASPSDRIERIERLMVELGAQLDTLKHEVRESRVASPEPSSRPAIADLLTDREKALARASWTSFRTSAAGYTFDADLPIGMHLQRWWGPWGARLEGGAILSDNYRIAGASVDALYSLHRFTALGLLETHLYTFGGTGFYWHRHENGANINQNWYETPDRWVRGRLGVGTEFSFFGIGGVRLTPEVGLQADQYFSRFEDSPSWSVNWPSSAAPKSDFSLAPFAAFHIAFYFQ
jgi:hypothetical protein